MKFSIGIIFGFIAAASLAFFAWAPIEIVQIWNSAVIAEASTQGALNLAKLAQIMIYSLPTLYTALIIYWVSTGMWALGIVFITSTAISLAALSQKNNHTTFV